MCFSPEASFASAAVLLPFGAFTLRSALRTAPRMWPFALVPCVFGLQQACEGFVWFGLERGDESLTRPAARAYLFFALAFWPFWFSTCAAIIEPKRGRRWLLAAFALLSTGWFWFAYLPVLTDPLAAGACVCHHSIRYTYSDTFVVGSFGPWELRAAYLLTAALPVGFCSLRRVLLVPLALAAASAGAAAVVFDYAFTSVWCLFAAVLSVSIAHTIAHAAVPWTAESLVPAWGRAEVSPSFQPEQT